MLHISDSTSKLSLQTLSAWTSCRHSFSLGSGSLVGVHDPQLGNQEQSWRRHRCVCPNWGESTNFLEPKTSQLEIHSYREKYIFDIVIHTSYPSSTVCWEGWTLKAGGLDTSWSSLTISKTITGTTNCFHQCQRNKLPLKESLDIDALDIVKKLSDLEEKECTWPPLSHQSVLLYSSLRWLLRLFLRRLRFLLCEGRLLLQGSKDLNSVLKALDMINHCIELYVGGAQLFKGMNGPAEVLYKLFNKSALQSQ